MAADKQPFPFGGGCLFHGGGKRVASFRLTPPSDGMLKENQSCLSERGVHDTFSTESPV
jgi:hypothetical protein